MLCLFAKFVAMTKCVLVCKCSFNRLIWNSTTCLQNVLLAKEEKTVLKRMSRQALCLSLMPLINLHIN